MPTTSWILRAATALAAIATIVAFAPPSRAYLVAGVPYPEGPLVGAWVEVDLSETAPRGSRLILVQSGDRGRRAQRVPMRTMREGRDPEATVLYGVATSRLVADRVYDVCLVARGGVALYVPAAFTARAPRLTSVTAAAGRGEAASATIAYASRRTRIRVGNKNARILSGPGEAEVVFEVPKDLSRDITRTTVAVATAGTRFTAPMTILPEPRVMNAVVDGANVSCNRQSYSATASGVSIGGERAVRGRDGVASEAISIDLPVDLSTLTFPVTFTEQGGGVVWWTNDALDGPLGAFYAGRGGSYRPGPPVGTFTVTIESFDGTRLVGTFSAHLLERQPDGPLPDRRELDVADGQFEVDPR